MKPIFIALVIALTSSSLLVQEQAGSAIPESQKRDITIPSANGDPIRISYGGDAASVKVDGNQLAAKSDVVATPNASRHLQGDDAGEGEAVELATDPDELAQSEDIIEMTENDVATEELAEAAEQVLDDPEATVIQRANAVLILLTPVKNDDDNTDSSNPEDDQVVLSRSQANEIKAVVALLVANVPDDTLTDVQDTVALDETPEAALEGDRRKHLRARRVKALRRVSKLRSMRRRHRSMSIRGHVSRNHRVASNFGRRRVLRLSAPHFVRYTAAPSQNRHLVGTPVPKIEATAPVTENKEVV